MKLLTKLTAAAVLLCMLLASCAPNSTPKARQSEKLNVIATIFPQYDFVRQIAGDKVDLTMLLPPNTESHSFEPTPQDIIKINNCDVFIYVGGESDKWIDGILDSINTDKIKTISLLDLVDVVEEEIIDGMDADKDDDGEYDEHVWTSPKNAKAIVKSINKALCEMDSTNASTYEENTAAYLKKLNELDGAFQKAVDDGSRKTLVFGDRFPFRYLVDAYELDYFAAFPGCSAESEPSAATIAFLIDKVRDEKIPFVFYVAMSNEKIADTICEETGAKKLALHACHNITKTDFENGVTYLDIMAKNAQTLKEALK